MACGGSPAEDFPDKVMPRAAPCTCSKKCRGRSGSVVFLGLFLLSLCLHAVTLVCYLDLRSEVKREIIHQKRDSMLTLAGSDLADPAAVLSPGHPRLDPGGGSGSRGGEGHEVKKKKKRNRKGKKKKSIVFIPHMEAVRVHSPPCSPPVPVSRCQVLCLRSVKACFLGNFFHSSLSRSFASSVSRQIY